MEAETKGPESSAVDQSKRVEEEYPRTPIEEIPKIVSQLRKNFESRKPLSLEWRVNQLKCLFKLVKENEEKFVSALRDYYGTNYDKVGIQWTQIWGIYESIQKLIDNLENYMNGKGYHGKDSKIPQDFPFNIAWGAKLKPVAKGLVLIIAPWNFPLSLVVEPAAAAIAAGNSIVLKPSEITGKISQLLQDLIPKYMDTSMIQIVNGGAKEATELLKYKFDFILYTGSTFVGKIVMAAASKHLTPVALELGGKNPVFMCDSIASNKQNFEIALKRIFWGRWLTNTGQICMAPEYILISKNYVPLCVQILKKLMNEYLINYNNNDKQINKSPYYGRIVNTRHFDRVNKIRKFYLEKYPKHILFGNTSNIDGDTFEAAIGKENHETRYIPPMAVQISLNELEAQAEVCEIMKSEVFGPILTIVSCDEQGGSNEWKDRILKIIDNDEMNKEYPIKEPLSCYVFSKDKEFVNYFEERIAAGSVVVNDVMMHFKLKNFPFGGKGASGMGDYHTNNSFDAFTHFKPCAETGFKTGFLTNFRYPDGDIAMYKSTVPEEIKDKNSLLTNIVYGVVCGGIACAAGYGIYSQYGDQIVDFVKKVKIEYN